MIKQINMKTNECRVGSTYYVCCRIYGEVFNLIKSLTGAKRLY